MLQQTTVAAVIPYFERFLEKFPRVDDLAQANEADVLRLWEGLGYYSRARNLHAAAKVIVARHSGQFPMDLAELHSLPGVGRYTAGAIASFAFDLAAPIVEANTLRLYCRLMGYDGDPRSKEGQEILWEFAEAILPKTSPGRLNQALMELGATLCSPRDPDCSHCPVQEHCAAFRNGTQSSIPRPKTRVEITETTEVSIAICKGSEYLLRKRTAQERWAGMWDFIRFEIANDPKVDLERIGNTVLEWTGLNVEMTSQVAEIRHSVTRYRITLKCFIADRIAGRLKSGEEWIWARPADMEQLPLSVTARQFADRLKLWTQPSTTKIR